MQGRLLAAIPLYGGIYSCAQAALNNMLLATQRAYPKLRVEVFCTERQLIYRAREQIRRFAVRGKFDYVYWQDEDILVKENTLIRLLHKDKQAVSALYFGRYPLYNPFLFYQVDLSPRFKAAVDVPLGGLIEVDACGLGCALVKKEVLEAVPEGCFRALNDRGEDINFWWCVTRAGFKVWVDTANQVGHIHQKETIIDAEYRKNALEEALRGSTWDAAKPKKRVILT